MSSNDNNFIEVGTLTVTCEHHSSMGIKSMESVLYDRHHLITEREQAEHIDWSLSIEDSMTDGVELVKARLATKFAVTYKSISKFRTKDDEELEKEQVKKIELDPTKYQICRHVTTEIALKNGNIGRETTIEHVCSREDCTTDITEKLTKDHLVDYSGDIFGNDGATWVGRYNNVPGKINSEGGTSQKPEMYNCWVQNIGSHKYGEILVTNKKIEWKPFKKGDPPDSHLVHDNMSTPADGKLVVGKSHEGEPGKLNFFDDGNKPTSNYQHLWCHHSGKCTSGKALRLL